MQSEYTVTANPAQPIGRPRTLLDVAKRAHSFGDFGRELQDWLHTLRTLRSRTAIAEAIASEPEFLDARFAEGAIADAWLAAYAEHLATIFKLPLPAWAKSSARIPSQPWFESTTPALRMMALRDTPAAFKRRNLYTATVDVPVRLAAGRPPVSAEKLRANNAERQRRFRARRRQELHALRAARR